MSFKTRVLLPLALLGCLGIVVAAAIPWRADRQTAPTSKSASAPPSDQSKIEIAQLEPRVAAFCGDCHAVPLAASFPRDGWYHEVNRGFDFYYASNRTDLKPPPKKDVLAYYRHLAPRELPLPDVSPETAQRILKFRKMEVAIPFDGKKAAPAVAHLNWVAGPDGQADENALFLCDMRSGVYQEIFLGGGRVKMGRQALLDNPCHSEPTDLDGDGVVDFVLADLGSMLPEDHHRGRVMWLSGKRWAQPIELAAGFGRVADVRPGDFNQDGAIDLIVAVFGWQTTGEIVLLTNTGEIKQGVPQFRTTSVDPRHGTIHTPVFDFNSDGRLDFVSVLGQEHEAVELFLNEGQNGFRRERLFSGNDPAFGSSGIELVDLDQDGDQDILYTNGDTLDSFYLKPYHAVHWLENQGEFRWRDHVLARMPGVHRALAGDLDQDGDLDIVAAASVSGTLMSTHGETPLDSIIWLEQTDPGKFVRHALERQDCRHVALEMADFDHDGDLDLAVGNFSSAPRSDLTIWWNETPAAK